MNRAVRIAVAVTCGCIGAAAWSLVVVLTFMEFSYGQTTDHQASSWRR